MLLCIKHLRTIAILLALSLTPLPLGAVEHDGKKLHLYGDSAAAIGRGGTGVASQGTDLFYHNPASIATVNRWSIAMNYGTLPIQTDYINPDLSISVPTSYGVMGMSFRYYSIPDGAAFTDGYSGTFGIGKEITNQLLVGFSLSIFYGADGGSSLFTGGSLGAIYRFQGMSGRGIGIFDPGIGATVRFGYPFGDDSDAVDFNTAVLGYQFSFLKLSNLTLTLFNEVTLYNYRQFPVTLGMEALIFESFVVRAGGAFMNEFDYGDITAGLGYNFAFHDINGSVNYALCYYTDGILVHNIGLNIQFGLSDPEPPVTSISAGLSDISPNHDGIQDYVVFNIHVSDRSRIKGWRLQILDEAENLVNEFRISDREMKDQLSFTGFFSRLFRRQETAVVPEEIIWEGTDSKRTILPDGRYHYAFNAWDEKNNISLLKKGTIYLDNTAPQVDVQTAELIFTPNKDYKKDELVIQQKVTTGMDDVWTAEFRNSSGIPVRKYKWTGYEVPKKLIWDGTDNTGNDVPEGLYDYLISSTDKAGNKALARITSITLTRKYDVADITLSAEYFSRKIDKEITITTHLSGTSGLETWGIAVADEDKEILRDISGYEYLKQVPFDGKDGKGAYLADGKYFITYTCLFHNGNMPQSFEKPLIIDGTPPRLGISHSPGLFSPDGDGENDLLTLSLKGLDTFGIKNWRLIVYTQAGNIFKTFEGNGSVPSDLKWDGYSDFGELVESATIYFAELSCFDMAGNYSKTSKERIRVDVLVLETDKDLRIQVSNIEFVQGKYDITNKGKQVLSRVAGLLDKYEKYSVIIEGHTDDFGSEEFNLDLSEKRAKSVMNHLVKHGINAGRLTFLGMGETTPLFPNNSDENKRRNRRIEFILKKE